MKWTNSKQFKGTEQKPCLSLCDDAVFVIGGVSYVGTVRTDSGSEECDFYLDFPSYNDVVFTELGIDKRDFTKSTLGYVAVSGIWPNCENLKDLTKLVKALLKECEKHNVKLEEEKVKSVTEPRKGSLENPWDMESQYSSRMIPLGEFYGYSNGVVMQRVK
jgi:hypothetical protein